MDGLSLVLPLLPLNVRRAAERLGERERTGMSELRLCRGSIPALQLPDGEHPLRGCAPVGEAELTELVQRATASSPYAAEDMLRRGFLSAGGVRIGVCGEVCTENGRIRTIRRISSACIRIPREVRGCAERMFDRGCPSTLIVSPPGGGKTTLLRDALRCLSAAGERVAVCDERGEIAAENGTGRGFDIGERTDVLTYGAKSETALMLLRSMSPDRIAMDEITVGEDISACVSIAHCGVRLLATAHAADTEELCKRPLYRRLLAERVFDRAVVISRRGAERTYREVSL